jgi:hypothetical protein
MSDGQPLEWACGCKARPWPDPTHKQQTSPDFEVIWQVIKDWDIHVPNVNNAGEYTHATGNHVRAILDAFPQPSREETMIQTLRALGEVLATSTDEELRKLCT